MFLDRTVTPVKRGESVSASIAAADKEEDGVGVVWAASIAVMLLGEGVRLGGRRKKSDGQSINQLTDWSSQ